MQPDTPALLNVDALANEIRRVDGDHENRLGAGALAEVIVQYLSPTLDAQADRVDALEVAMHQIVQWADAYPLGMFTEPDFEEVKRLLGSALLSQVSASNMRHVVKGVGEIARKALTP